MTKAEYKAGLLKLDPEVRDTAEWALDNGYFKLKDFDADHFVRWANNVCRPGNGQREKHGEK